MKHKVFSFLTLFILCLIATSCSSDDEPGKDTGTESSPKVEIIGGTDAASIVFHQNGGEKSVKFKTSESWTVKVDGVDSSHEWLNVSPTTGRSGESAIILKASQNEQKEERKCQVSIVTPHAKATIDVKQMQKDALVVAKSSYTVEEKGGEIAIEVGHNVDFTIDIDGEWIQQKSARSYQTENLVFQVGANAGQNRRIGAVTFTSKDKKIIQKVRIIQESKESDKLNENYVPVDWKENKLVKCDPKNGVYSFVASDKNKPQLEKGSVFVVDVDTMAYIAIAKEVNDQNNVTTVKTVQGTMADVFHDLNFSLTTQKITNSRSVGNNVFYPTKVFVRSKDGFVPQSPISRANSSFTGDLWNWSDDMNGLELFSGSNYTVYLEQSEYNLSIDLQMDFNFGGIDEKAIVIDGIKRFLSKNLEVTASIIGTASTTQKIRADISGESMSDISNGELIKRNIFLPKVVIFNVYGVPVSIVLHSDLYLGGWVKAKGDINAWTGFTEALTGTLGLRWEQKTNAISPVIEHNNTVGLIPPTMEGKGTADIKACVFPRVCTSLYGVLGPSFDIKPFIRDSINGGFHEELLSSNKDYCAWNMNLFAGVDLDAGLRINFITHKDNPEDFLLSESNLPDSWKKWMYNEKHIYETPVDIELSKGNPNDIKQGKPIDVEFTVFDNIYLMKEPKQKTCLPQIVKFVAKGALKSKYGIAKDGIVTAHWTPSSASDSLRAILYDENMDVIKEAVFKAERDFKIQKESGDRQTGIPGKKLKLPLKVLAYMQDKNQEISHLGKEYQVQFQVISGGGSVSQQFTNVDAQNIATTLWILGKEEQQKVEAVIVDADTRKKVSEPVYFTAQKQKEPDEPASDLWVDLGLPSGVKWASHNVGATSPEGYGDYFAWGETSPKVSYSYENSLTIGKKMGDISGNPQYDAATANWGGGARMPTVAECKELVMHCTSEWTVHNGVNGRLVTGPNGNSIFLPAAGYRDGPYFDEAGECGWYWSSTPNKDHAYPGAYDFYFRNVFFGWDGFRDSSDGLSIRPVRN